MNDPSDHSIQYLIDEQCDRFENALKAGQTPDPQDFIAAVPESIRDRLMQELIVLAQDYERSRSGFEPTLALNNYQTTPGSDNTIDNHWTGPAPAPGTSLKYFGNYEILGEIARGGMGVVYRARQTSLGRIVALKMILSGDLAGDREISRFRSEAEAAATLDHPGIVPIFEVGQHNDHHYFSMGLVEGPSLSETLRDGPMTSRAAAEMLSKIADAVGYANAKGIIHRDLKPGNILLDSGRDPHITDFGLAKRLQADKELTTTGEVLGTPAYMPPEQARGDLPAIGPHSDVYSLGAMLFAMLSGRPPHAAPSMMETLRQVIEVDAISVRSLNPGVPKDLETICAKCLSKDPNQRYQNAYELRDELQRFLRGEPIHARPVSRIERIWRWSRRRPALASLSAALTILILTLAIGGPIIAVNQARLTRIAEENESRATELAESERNAKEQVERSQAELTSAKDRSDHALYARTVSLALQEWQSGNLTSAEDLLASLPPSQRGFEWHYVDSLCHAEQQAFVDMSSLPKYVDMAADGVHVIAVGRGQTDAENKTYVWKIGSNERPSIHNGRAMAISQDGSLVIRNDPQDSAKAQVFDVITGEVLQTLVGHEKLVGYAAFGGDRNSIIATSGSDKTVRIWNRESGKEIVKIDQVYRQRLSPLAVSRDGSSVAWRRVDDGGIEIRDCQTGNIRFNGPLSTDMTGHEAPVGFSPDGSMLAVGGHGEIALLRSPSGNEVGRLFGIRGKAIAIDFSPDSKRLAVTCQDGVIRIFDTQTQRLLTTMTGHKAGQSYGVIAVAFDGSGDRIVSGGHDAVVKVWDAWNGDRESISLSTRPWTQLPPPSQTADYFTGFLKSVESLRFSRDGKRLFVVGADFSIRCIDPVTGRMLRELKDLGQNIGAIDFDANHGRVLAGGGGIRETKPGVVACWDFDSGDEMWRFDDAIGPISQLHLFGDGKYLAVSIGGQNTTRGQLLVLDALTGKIVVQNESSLVSIRDLAVSPDGQTIATVGIEPGIQLWGVEKLKPLRKIDERIFFSVAFSGDGSKLAAGGLDWSVRMFDLVSGDTLWSQIRHGGAVFGVQFIQNDTRLVSTSLDSHTRIWDTRYGDSILALRDSDQANLSLAVSEDASMVAVGGIDSAVVIRKCFPTSKGTIAHSLVADRTDDWITIFSDDFQRDVLGDYWTATSGRWRIEDGVAVGELQPSKYAAGLNTATLVPKQKLAGDVQIACDCWIDQPMIMELKTSDPAYVSGISGLFIGIAPSPFNRGEKGVSILQNVGGSYRELASRREGSFAFETGRKYRLAMRRIGRRTELLIDDEPYREAEFQMDVRMPLLVLQGLLGKVGSEVRLDNIEIKVRSDGEAEIRAAGIVSDLFESEKLKPLVLAKLQTIGSDLLGDDANATRLAAIDIARTWPQESETILAAIEQLATDGTGSDENYRILLQWLIDETSSKDIRTYLAMAMTSHRLNDIGTVWESANQASRLYQNKFGTKHPIAVALVGLRYQLSDRQEKVVEELRQLEELIRADHFRNDELVQRWSVIARESIQAPADDAITESLKNSTWQVQHSLTIESDPEPLARIMAANATRRIVRVVGDDPHAMTIRGDDWIESERLWSLGGPAAQGRLTRTNVKVNLVPETPTVTSWFVKNFADGFYEWVQQDVFVKSTDTPPKEWKVVKQTSRVTKLLIGGQTFDIQRDGWTELDAKVAEAKQSASTLAQARSLFFANRFKEAIEAAHQLVLEDDNAFAHARLAELTHSIADVKLLRDAMRRAVELDPMVAGPPGLRGFAAQMLAAIDPVKVTENIAVFPPSFYRRAPNVLLAAGESGLAAWQPTDDSLIGIVRLPKPDEDDGGSLGEGVDAIIKSRETSLKVKLLRRATRQLDGFKAEEFVQQGAGIGRAMGSGTLPTLQRFVIIERDKDLLLFFVSSYQNVFEMRDAEFEQFLVGAQLTATLKENNKGRRDSETQQNQ